MHEAEKLSLEQIRGFVAAGEELRFERKPPPSATPGGAGVEEQQYARRAKAARGLLRRYVEKMTGFAEWASAALRDCAPRR